MKITTRSMFGISARFALGLAAALAVCGFMLSSATAAEKAKNLFGAKVLPALAAPQSFGFYSKGCFAGGVALPLDGPTWQVMRPSRNRRWGHPELIGLLEKFSRDAAAEGWRGLLVGDIAQPRGGPMLTGHASHQIGLDADIWFTPMPARRYSLAQRDTVGAVSLIRPGTHLVDERKWAPVYARLLRQAASYPEVERIFVNPGIKKKLCDTVSGDRAWLNKIRPLWGHDSHFHIRISCPPGSTGCKPQRGTGTADGCGEQLAWWFTDEPWRPAKGPQKPKARDVMTMADLPKACQVVLGEPAPLSADAVTYWAKGTAVAASGAPEAPAAAMPAMPDTASAFVPTPKVDIPLPLPRP
ncbi:penicillin-insensitive murein endopeptidase [Manganibacter manganicus]|uniref:Penicillin-insensitive murein endopeptidase n=1 Tax=Manganibacter manganicus TaxID=1873176 RepID=A0A1V8RSZ2_9HYPH|nr:penicillin-insensitive murein endopeptidase [Pseudaminobacter manganicus]OQM76332.1 penicillin-insensitive murein endopeptidase [Pseudaminobacter manganicus]